MKKLYRGIGSKENLIEAYNRFVPNKIFHLMGKKRVEDVVLGDCIEKRMTILFSDMRDFTALSESMTPRQNFSFINSYLARMEPVITRHYGIIDKYIGDAIMALFPAGADDALDGAIDMLNELAAYNEERRKEGKQPVAIGIGLNTGHMMLGIIGGRERMASTVISDAVNLSSRIETMTKSYGLSLLISEHTYYSLSNSTKYKIRFADRVKIKGKEQPQSIYEVFDADPPDIRAAKQKTIRIFERAIAYYYLKEIPMALELFKECLEQCPGDKLAKVYYDRCEVFLNTGLYEGTGIINLSIEWTRENEIGIPEIDEQHRQLFISANEFAAKIKKDQNFSHAGPMMDFLNKYVQEHFETEENYMEKYGYPFLDFQKDQHHRFANLIKNLKSELEEDNGSDWHFLLVKIQVRIMDWLVHHTSKLDRHFGKFLKLQTTGEEENIL